MAHKKGGGSSRNGRDSNSQRRGTKEPDGKVVTGGSILVRQVGNRTFYRRNNQWIDSTVTKEQENNPIRVKQFSDHYFRLARNQGRTLAQYMAFDEPVLVNLEGKAYLIEP